MLISDNELDMHINPNFVVRVWKTGGSETHYSMKLYGDCDRIHIDKDSYDRIVEWMDKHYG